MSAEKLILIKTVEEMQNLQTYLKKYDYISFDTETTGVDKESKIIGFSVSAEPNVGYYVILSYWDPITKNLVDLSTTTYVETFLRSLTGKQLIMHNAIFDCHMVANNYDIRLIDSVHTDTMILGHLLNENRSNGLKELGAAIFGADATIEQRLMKDSVSANGGVLTKDKYELYKADADLLGKYGAKDAVLTYNLFCHFVPQLFEQGLDSFFYHDESMPQLKLVTYDLNTTGLKVDGEKLRVLQGQLEASILEARAFIDTEIKQHVLEKYKGTTKTNTFNISSSRQLSWLLYIKLGNEFYTLTDEGRAVCKALNLRLPYSPKAKREFIAACTNNKGYVYQDAAFNPKTKKMGRPKKIGDAWNYIACGKESLSRLEDTYKWVKELLVHNKNTKLLSTYVKGLQDRVKYGIIAPSFLQHGTTSGRYSSKNPNFQNLPRDDKRVKACIVSRPDKVFVGADYSQLEPRVFASFSGDERLQKTFSDGLDFYSVIGMEIFNKHDCEPYKEGNNAFGTKYKKLRDIAKTVALASVYGTTAAKMSTTIKRSIEEAQDVIDNYFIKFPSVYKLMIDSHEIAKNKGSVYNLYGRPRRMPEAMKIKELYGNIPHNELPYTDRNLLNLAINHRIQSTGASIINRAAIAFKQKLKENNILDCHIVMQVHDELIVECHKNMVEIVTVLLKEAMENTVELPGVRLEAIPKVANNLADLK